jgi:hypothetical protein
MKRSKDWKVVHHHENPKREEIEFFSRQADAVRSVRAMESKDWEDSQYSTVENVRTGCRGSRRWGRRKISWTQGEPARGISPSPREITEGHTQLAFAASADRKDPDLEVK